MKANKLILAIALTIIMLPFKIIAACLPDNDDTIHVAIKDNGNYITFHKKAIDDFPHKPEAYQIRVKYFDCETKKSRVIGDLGYINDPGKIDSAFLGNIPDNGEKLFIIQSIDLRWPYDEPYGRASDYFTVYVYDDRGDNYIADEKSTRYFGHGADLFNYMSENNDILYTYPYKREIDVRAAISSPIYIDWLNETNKVYTVNTKSFLHSEPLFIDKTNKYLIKGDNVQISDIKSGWVEVRYENKIKNKVITGWIEQKYINY